MLIAKSRRCGRKRIHGGFWRIRCARGISDLKSPARHDTHALEADIRKGTEFTYFKAFLLDHEFANGDAPSDCVKHHAASF